MNVRGADRRLLQEPDLGSVVVICVTVFGMLFLAGVRFWHFMVVVGAGVGGMVLLTVVAPYRLARVTGFLVPTCLAVREA